MILSGNGIHRQSRAVILFQIRRKMTGNNPNLYLVNMNVYITFGKILLICSKILSENEILTSIMGHNSDPDLPKMTGNNPNLDLVNIIAYTKFCRIMSICSKDIKQKRNSDINQGHNSVTNKTKMIGNISNLDLVSISVYIKFDLFSRYRAETKS